MNFEFPELTLMHLKLLYTCILKLAKGILMGEQPHDISNNNFPIHNFSLDF